MTASGGESRHSALSPRILSLCVLPAAVVAALLTYIVNALGLYKLLYRLLSRHSRKAGYGVAFLQGNFAPVHNEVAEQQLEVVEGRLPRELSGVYMRNGPNPFFQPVAGYHWFDGDGMLHAVRIKDGAASYANHLIRTDKLEAEQKDGWPSSLQLGDMVGLGGVGLIMAYKAREYLHALGARAVPSLRAHARGGVTANAALVVHASKILALHERDVPYHVRVTCNGLLTTLGRHDWDGQLKTHFTAHPKLDPVTGKLHYFSYNLTVAPWATYGWVEPDGSLGGTVALDLRRPIMMHDCAITAKHVIFLDCPLLFAPKQMVENNTLPFVFDASFGSRIGLLPLCAPPGTPVTWFPLDSCFILHTAAAWEEADGVVKLFASHQHSLNLELLARMGTARGVPEQEQPRLAEITLDPRTGMASMRQLSPVVGDLPIINPNNTGRRTRYVYMATMVTSDPAIKWDGIAKLDLQVPAGKDACIKRITLPAGTFTGEAVFVPRHEDPSSLRGEDDGFLVAYTHDEGTERSTLTVWDARSIASKPLAVVALPQRIPYGFHGLWVPEGELRKQLQG